MYCEAEEENKTATITLKCDTFRVFDTFSAIHTHSPESERKSRASAKKILF